MGTLLPDETRAQARGIIAHHSKSFSLAARLLPAGVRDDARVVYAWCRRADDAVDTAPPSQQRFELRRLHVELASIYTGASLRDPVLAGFRQVVRRRRIPRRYPEELLAGMDMDVRGTHYDSFAPLSRYCYRVAGTVGLMMCHVMRVRRERALVRAAHLGTAMQLTNICRDVAEDWQRGRLYLPDDMLAASGAPRLRARLGQPFPPDAREPVARVIAALLARAEGYYRSGDVGLRELSPRCAFGVRAARLIYSRIGHVLRARECDPLAGRAVVGKGRKLGLAARAAVETLMWLPLWLFAGRLAIPRSEISYAATGVTS